MVREIKVEMLKDGLRVANMKVYNIEMNQSRLCTYA